MHVWKGRNVSDEDRDREDRERGRWDNGEIMTAVIAISTLPQARPL
jgi:hypothetical protein